MVKEFGIIQIERKVKNEDVIDESLIEKEKTEEITSKITDETVKAQWEEATLHDYEKPLDK